MKHVLLIGGTGVFGERLARHLMGFEGIRLTVTSRSRSKADALANTLQALGTGVKVAGVALDTQSNFATQLAALNPWAVVDCSGPFQGAGYDTARTVLQHGAHMIDLADARSYLLGHEAALDELARKKGVTGLAGASSTPALSSAVVAELAHEFAHIDEITIAITPGGKGDVGEAVIGAIMTYAGKDIPVWQNGALSITRGWLKAAKIDMPHLGIRQVAPVETADAEMLGPRYKVRNSVRFYAGLESPIEQYGVRFLALLRRLHLFPDPRFLTPLLAKARRFTRIGMTDRGGMIVLVEGIDHSGEPLTKRWSLLAENNDGPCVPIMAAAAAIRQLLQGSLEPGAKAANGQLKLDDIENEMAGYAITTEVVTA